ncbi:MAG: DUF2007 domain-containing protein [Bdellovibrionales bacterium]|nr:DUF2007 domain-containing protein [Bdellovibrionales bacterium]
MDEQWVVVAAYLEHTEAHLARITLEAHDIPCRLIDEHTVSLGLLYAGAIGGIKLLVPQRFAEEASRVLGPASSPDVAESSEDTAARCERCGGQFRPQNTGRRTILTWLLIGLPLVWPKRTLRCDVCGHVVPRSRADEI